VSLSSPGLSPLGSRLLIAERFVAPCASLAEVVIPLDVIAPRSTRRLRIAVIAEDGPEYRMTTFSHSAFSDRDSLRLSFAPFDAAPGATFFVGVLDVGERVAHDVDLARIRGAATDRSPIVLDCRGAEDGRDLLLDEHSICAFRVTPSDSEIRTAYWIDAFWCDAFGVFLQGWVHAFQHPVRGARIESAGRSARVSDFSDRPDLLDHYPEYEHVRRAGFTVYLDCPPGHPLHLVVETDAGIAKVSLPLPHGPVPPWPIDEEPEDEISPMMRRFAELANAHGGRVLQIGSRVPRGADAVPPRSLFRAPLIGLDIHPGCNVDVVGDAHGLSRFLRPSSLDGAFSASVLEHLEAPWVVAAEINRVLKLGGVVYQQVPGAWPAHAQPNDFWRFSAEGLRVLFGAASGFEVLEYRDSGRAAIIPSPEWRVRYLEMPTVPAFAMAEVLARKVADLEPGRVAWPLTARQSETRSHQYPLTALRPGKGSAGKR
jgi:SAM-dependent methyltransferase